LFDVTPGTPVAIALRRLKTFLALAERSTMKPTRFLLALGCLALFLLLVPSLAVAKGGPQIDERDTVVMKGNTHPLAQPKSEVGRAALAHPMEHMVLSLKVKDGATLDAFLAEAQDPSSMNYHRWLTPDEFGARFGRSDDEIKALVDWLQGNGFAIEEVAAGR